MKKTALVELTHVELTRDDLTATAMVNGNEDRFTLVIFEGTVRRWVGFGWVDEGAPTAEQATSLPRVAD